MLVILVPVAVLIGFSVNILTFANKRAATVFADSLQSYYAAEAGIEDSLLRLVDPDLMHSSDTNFTINGATATITTAQAGSQYTITSEGEDSNRFRKVSTVLQENTSGASFFYGVQVDEGGLIMSNNATVNGSVYSNGSIQGNSGARITGDAIVAGGLEENPQDEWVSNDTDQLFATASSNRDIAQSFIATESGPVPQVSMFLGKVGSPGNITLRITTDNSGKPDTSSLSSITIPASAVGSTPDWIDIALSSPPDVASGTKYWIVLDYGNNSASHHWNWRKDSTDGYANNQGIYTGNWSSSSATWTSVNGDLAFRVWIGGTATGIQDITIGDSTSGIGHANSFTNVTIHGSLCPNQYCVVENPPRTNMPISEAQIQTWKAEAAAGGTHSGNYTLTNGASGTLGPIEVTGDLELNNSAILTLAGTVWVHGNVQLSNNCVVGLDAGYGASSGVLIVDGVVQVSNGCTFSGSGDPESSIMVLSDREDPNGTVISVDNNAVGVIYYASRGRIFFSNNAAAKEAVGYGISLDNNASITYQSGLQDLRFSSGPAGGWDIISWQEVE